MRSRFMLAVALAVAASAGTYRYLSARDYTPAHREDVSTRPVAGLKLLSFAR